MAEKRLSEEVLERSVDTVPSVYFQEDFCFTNVIFTENSDFHGCIRDLLEKQQTLSLELQEYIDVIEEALYRHVRAAHRENLFDLLLEQIQSINVQEALQAVTTF